MLSQRRGSIAAAMSLLAALTGAVLLLPTGNQPTSIGALRERDCPSGTCSDPNNSFEPDTLVRMADGSQQRLDTVAVGDRVTTAGGSGQVLAVIRGTGNKNLVEVNGGLTATAGHRLLTARGWVTAGELVIGDVLLGPGASVLVASLHTGSRFATVLNLDVSGPGTFLVSASGTDVAVHE